MGLGGGLGLLNSYSHHVYISALLPNLIHGCVPNKNDKQ